MKLILELGPNITLNPLPVGSTAALSPDGNVLAFSALDNESSKRGLYVRRLDQLKSFLLQGTEGAGGWPLFSPDGRWIAFGAGDMILKKIPVSGGAVERICDGPGGWFRPGSWTEDGTIVFWSSLGLMRVPASGGKAEPLTRQNRPGEYFMMFPQLLPGGRAVLGATRRVGGSDLMVQSVPEGVAGIVQRDAGLGRYVPSGHLVFYRQGKLFAAPFDLDRLEVSGPAIEVLERLNAATDSQGATLAFSENGSMVYRPGSGDSTTRYLEWLDESGEPKPMRAAPGNFTNPRFSPDGKRLAMAVPDGDRTDIWSYEWERDVLFRVTSMSVRNLSPVWAPGGRHIVFEADRDDAIRQIFWMRADGVGEPERLTSLKNFNDRQPFSFSPDGRFLAYGDQDPSSRWDIWILPLDLSQPEHPKPGKPEPFVQTPAIELGALFSPDGHWLAYQSNESGKHEIYVVPFPGPGTKYPVSTNGGMFPLWSPAGRELFYVTDRRIMAVRYTIQEGNVFVAGKPRPWSAQLLPHGPEVGQTRGVPGMDIAPDGRRFVVVRTVAEPEVLGPGSLLLITNFFDELRRRVPAGGGR